MAPVLVMIIGDPPLTRLENDDGSMILQDYDSIRFGMVLVL